MLKAYRADLHIHTCLSPCAELEMSPRGIVRTAREREIQILGICDHNSAENVPAIRDAARPYRISILAGMEIASQEEVHVLGLFDSLDSALAIQEIVYAHLPGENDEEAFGIQAVVNEEGEILRFNEKLLIGATTLTLAKVVEIIHDHGGLAIAAHVDREGFSIIGQLGFIPGNLPLDALEVSPAITLEAAREKYSPRFPLTTASDAHRLDEIGRVSTSFWIAAGTVAEIRKALVQEDGRKIVH
ncbi:MAG: PHP domain-containing protein [Candidatus Aminicenantales bacterium]